jgi:hypothetical protein
MKSLVLLFIIIYIHIVSSLIISLAYSIHNITIYHQLAFFIHIGQRGQNIVVYTQGRQKST